MTLEQIASKIVDEGIPILLMGGGKTTVLKLKYCPVCGSYVKLNYGNGLNYWAVMWRCGDRECEMSEEDKPLDGWNEENEPGFGVIIEMIPVPI